MRIVWRIVTLREIPTITWAIGQLKKQFTSRIVILREILTITTSMYNIFIK